MSEPIEAHNLLCNPKPASKTGWVMFRASGVFDGLAMRLSGTTANSYATCPVDVLAPGDYVAAARLDTVGDGAQFSGNQCLMMVLPLPDGGTTYRTALYDTAGRFYTAEFTYEPVSGRKPELLLRTPIGTTETPSVCAWSHMLLVTREDWETMQTNNVTWFDGDGFLTGEGTPS